MTLTHDAVKRCILHLDMDAFFAEVELLRRPELRDKPVVVGGRGDPTQRGVVSTATYEARKFGIHSGMPLRTAYQRCRRTVFLPVDYPAYAAMSKKVKAVLRAFSEVMEDVGIDEAFLDLSDSKHPPAVVAKAIKNRIKAETGLPCSIGIAPNKLLAKIASDMEKPDGLTIIREQDIETRIWPLAVRKLRGVGPKTEQKLRRLGVATIGDLAALPEHVLAGHIGQSLGRYLAQAARGHDERPLVTHRNPKSLSRETTFQTDVADRQALHGTLRDLSRDVASRLQARGFAGRVVTVKLRFSDFKTCTRATTLAAPTNEAKGILDAALRCLTRFEMNKKVRLLGVRVGDLAA